MITTRQTIWGIGLAGLAGIAALAASTAANAGHSELRVPAADTFMLGGDQAAPMSVSGTNDGSTSVVILSRVGGKDVMLTTVAPGGRFEHVYGPGQMALIRNLSPDKAAYLSVDFTGSTSSLSMRYALPQKP